MQLKAHIDPSIRPVTRDDSYFVRVEVESAVVTAFADHSVKEEREGRQPV